jgi:hypothetical protein
MNTYEVSREDLMAELKRDLEAGKPLTNAPHKVRASKPMGKRERMLIHEAIETGLITDDSHLIS